MARPDRLPGAALPASRRPTLAAASVSIRLARRHAPAPGNALPARHRPGRGGVLWRVGVWRCLRWPVAPWSTTRWRTSWRQSARGRCLAGGETFVFGLEIVIIARPTSTRAVERGGATPRRRLSPMAGAAPPRTAAVIMPTFSTWRWAGCARAGVVSPLVNSCWMSVSGPGCGDAAAAWPPPLAGGERLGGTFADAHQPADHRGAEDGAGSDAGGVVRFVACVARWARRWRQPRWRRWRATRLVSGLVAGWCQCARRRSPWNVRQLGWVVSRTPICSELRERCADASAALAIELRFGIKTGANAFFYWRRWRRARTRRTPNCAFVATAPGIFASSSGDTCAVPCARRASSPHRSCARGRAGILFLCTESRAQLAGARCATSSGARRCCAPIAPEHPLARRGMPSPHRAAASTAPLIAFERACAAINPHGVLCDANLVGVTPLRKEGVSWPRVWRAAGVLMREWPASPTWVRR